MIKTNSNITGILFLLLSLLINSLLEDWLWYLTFPLLAHTLLIVAAFMLPKNPSPALYIVGAAMMLLLLVGIRNAWDNVTFLAVERAHSENKSSE